MNADAPGCLEVDLEAGATLAAVEAAIVNRVLALSELIGAFSG